MDFESIGEYIVTDHAAFELERRGILLEQVQEVLRKPEQKLIVRKGRQVLQSRVVHEGKQYLIRVFVDVDRKPVEVVTAYRTSKLEKYWRSEP